MIFIFAFIFSADGTSHFFAISGRTDLRIGVSEPKFEPSETKWRLIFGRTDLRIGVSEAKFDLEDDFDIKESLAPPKSAEKHEKPKKQIEKFGSKNQPFLSFSRSHSETYVKISLPFKFCFRYTFPEVCATRNRDF